MFKREIAGLMTCEQYGAFIKTTIPVTHALPDGRMLLWYHEYDVHEFLTAWDVTHAEPGQQELPFNDPITEAVPVHACFSVTNNADKCDGTGSKDTGTEQGIGNTEEIPK